ncbi:hypothetical protein DFH07DRAFT_720087, partial [Mycena maculata]
MSSTTVLNDVLPSSVPSLKVTSEGNNLTIFSLCFRASVDAKGFLGHFTGTDPRPAYAAPWTQAQADELAKWDKAERNSKALLLQKVPDSVATIIDPMANVGLMWTYIIDTFSTKGAYAQTNLRSESLQ